MARMICRCGNELSNHQAPNDIELRVYTDKEWDAILNCEMIEPWKIPMPKRTVWKCPICKRLYVFDVGVDKPTAIYVIEDVN